MLAVVLLAGRAEAQPALTTPTPVAAKDPKAAKSSSTAVALGILPPLLVTGLGLSLLRGSGRSEALGPSLVLGGLIVGPAPGLWYGGHGSGLGMLARGVTLLVAVGAFVGLEEADHDDCISIQLGCDPEAEYAKYEREVLTLRIVLGLSAAAYLTSWVYDVREAGRVTDRWNRAHGFTVAPAVLSTTTGRAPGLMLGAQF